MGETTVMIVEDEALIGLDMAETLEDAGYEVLGPFASRKSALDQLQKGMPDVALLDVNLGANTNSFAVAHVLREAGCPFAFLTGYSASIVALEDEFGDVPRLAKPCSPGAIVETVAEMVEELCTDRRPTDNRVPAEHRSAF